MALRPPTSTHTPRYVLAHWDPGCTHSIISTHTLDTLQWTSFTTPLPHPHHLSDAAGHTTPIHTSITLDVQPHPRCPTLPETFLVSPTHSPTLLSGAWLRAHHATLDFSTNTYTLKHLNKPTSFTLDKPSFSGPTLPLHPSPTTHTHQAIPHSAGEEDYVLYTHHTSPSIGVPTFQPETLLTSPHNYRAPLTRTQHENALALIHKHIDVFLQPNKTNPVPPGLDEDIHYTVELIDPTTPPQFSCRNRSQPEHLLPLIRKHIADLLDKGKISVAMTNTPTASWATFHPKATPKGT